LEEKFKDMKEVITSCKSKKDKDLLSMNMSFFYQSMKIGIHAFKFL